MKKYDNIIAIDPDIHESGVALLHTATRGIDVMNFAFPQLLDYLIQIRTQCRITEESLIVVVEAGWLHSKSNFHGYHGGVSDNISKSVGANHETGRKIIEMCKHYGIEVVTQIPLKKMWKGTNGKITHEELSLFIPYLPKRTNQDARDAALIAWNYSGLPIRVKAK